MNDDEILNFPECIPNLSAVATNTVLVKFALHCTSLTNGRQSADRSFFIYKDKLFILRQFLKGFSMQAIFRCATL